MDNLWKIRITGHFDPTTGQSDPLASYCDDAAAFSLCDFAAALSARKKVVNMLLFLILLYSNTIAVHSIWSAETANLHTPLRHLQATGPVTE